MVRRPDQKSGIKLQIYPGYNLDKSEVKLGFIHFPPDLSKFYPRFVYIPPRSIHISLQINLVFNPRSAYILSQINLLVITSPIFSIFR
jgi:hypothetical protein